MNRSRHKIFHFDPRKGWDFHVGIVAPTLGQNLDAVIDELVVLVIVDVVGVEELDRAGAGSARTLFHLKILRCDREPVLIGIGGPARHGQRNKQQAISKARHVQFAFFSTAMLFSSIMISLKSFLS
jgi:hypothetical protein